MEKDKEHNAEINKEINKEKKEDKKDNISNKKDNITEKIRENPWMISTFVLGILTLILVVSNFSGNITGNVISSEEIGDTLLSFYESNGVQGLSLVSVEEVSGLYQVNFEYQGAVVPLYVTKDGELVGSLNPLGKADAEDSDNTQEPQEILKSDKPVVELFVMTHCPYGTQAEKGFLPTIAALGDNVDASVKFVHYFLHEPEETETPIQVCIREEQNDKFAPYLACFLEDGDSDRCLTEVNVDTNKLNECIDNGKSDEYYEVDSILSENYGVRGSPTLVINGQIVSSARSADAYLKTICSAFNTVPEICETAELDSANPSAGFGYDEASSAVASTAQC